MSDEIRFETRYLGFELYNGTYQLLVELENQEFAGIIIPGGLISEVSLANITSITFSHSRKGTLNEWELSPNRKQVVAVALSGRGSLCGGLRHQCSWANCRWDREHLFPTRHRVSATPDEDCSWVVCHWCRQRSRLENFTASQIRHYNLRSICTNEQSGCHLHRAGKLRRKNANEALRKSLFPVEKSNRARARW